MALGCVVVVTFVPLISVEFMSVNGFDVFPKRTGIRVAFGTARSFARIGFLGAKIT